MDARFFSKKSGFGILTLAVLILAFIFFWRWSAPVTHNGSVYRVARDTTWPQIDLAGKDLNMVAFTNELMIDLADRMGVKLELISVQQSNLITGLDSHDYEAVLTSSPLSNFDLRRYIASDPIYHSGPVLVMRQGEKIESLGRPEGAILGVRRGDPFLQQEIKEFPLIQVRQYEIIRQALDDLVEGNIDAVMIDAVNGHTFTHGLFQTRVEVVTPPLNNDGIHLITLNTPKESEFVRQFDDALKESMADGKYAELEGKWGILDTRSPHP